jgi:hypothetical protein
VFPVRYELDLYIYYLGEIQPLKGEHERVEQETRAPAQHSNVPPHAEFSDPFISYATADAFPANAVNVPLLFRHVIVFVTIVIAVLL